MNRILLTIVLLAVLITPSYANEWDKMVIPFNLGDTGAATTTESGIFRIPQSAKIDTIYVTDRSGFASSTTDYIQVVCYLNGSAYGTFTSSATPVVANTPLLLTPTAKLLVEGDVLQFRLVKQGSGQATTDMGVTVSYFNTTSR